MSESTWYLRTQDETFGPETREKLLEWARLGRIQPGQEVSDDNIVWQRVEEVPFLDMRFSIDLGDGNPRGPFNRAAAEALLASGRLPPTASLVETRAPFEAETEEGSRTPPSTCCASSASPRGMPVAAATDDTETVPPAAVTERVVEKVVEKIVEVPVEKLVEVEKIVVDDTRIRELEGLLAEERRHTNDLQSRMDAASKAASEAARTAAETESRLKADLHAAASKESRLKADLQAAAEKESHLKADLSAAAERETRLNADVQAAAEREAQLKADLETKESEKQHLAEELERLPQAASEVADIQAAMYGIMTGESEEILQTIEREKTEFEAYRKRHAERTDRLMERRRELLRRAGADIADMTHKALVNRPEDPRTAQLRSEYAEFRRMQEKTALESERRLNDLNEQLRVCRAEAARRQESQRDVSQLLQENQTLRETLQRTEKDLMELRQANEELQRQQATNQQTLLSRLATLESPSVGTVQSMETNQSREAKMVRLPGWMRLKR